MATENVTRTLADAVRNDLEHRLTPILHAAQLLAEHQRVHEAFEARASASPEFEQALRTACSTWRTPEDITDDGAVVALLRVALGEVGAIAQRCSAQA